MNATLKHVSQPFTNSGVPGVKWISSTDAASVYNLDSVANCVSFHSVSNKLLICKPYPTLDVNRGRWVLMYYFKVYHINYQDHTQTIKSQSKRHSKTHQIRPILMYHKIWEWYWNLV
jgi:hypothetical protein